MYELSGGIAIADGIFHDECLKFEETKKPDSLNPVFLFVVYFLVSNRYGAISIQGSRFYGVEINARV